MSLWPNMNLNLNRNVHACVHSSCRLAYTLFISVPHFALAAETLSIGPNVKKSVSFRWPSQRFRSRKSLFTFNFWNSCLPQATRPIPEKTGLGILIYMILHDLTLCIHCPIFWKCAQDCTGEYLLLISGTFLRSGQT